MKKIMLVIVGLAAMLLLAAPAATAQTTEDCDTYTTEVTGRPDSGGHGNWATDTFTRTTEVCGPVDGVWTLTLTDEGSFTTVAGALSPGAGVALPAEPITGQFEGGATVTVTSDTEPVAPPETSPGDKSSSEWASLLWPGNNGTISAWSWTYSYCEQTWVNGEAGSTGDVTGGVECETPPTTTTPPTTDPTTTPPPASSETTTSRPAVVGSAEEQEMLAATGTGGSVLPWLIVAGVVLLGGGGAALVIARRRKGEHQ